MDGCHIALREYFAALRARGKVTAPDERRADHDIVSSLGTIKLADLTTHRLETWLTDLAARHRHTRGAGGASSKPAAIPADARRRRMASANRTWTILRAALNAAFRRGEVASDAAWRRVKPFRGADFPKVRFFDRDELARLLGVIEGDFANLFRAALFSGCRYSELCRLRVKDFDGARLFVETSKTSKPRHIVLTDEGAAFFASIIRNRDLRAQMLTYDNEPWRSGDQSVPMAKACAAAGVEPAGVHVLRHTFASYSVMSGVPLEIVSKQLGHASIQMTQRYAHLAHGHIAQTIKQRGPRFSE